MNKLPSFEQFNESLKADINEGVFHRLPKNIISDELYLTSKNLQNFYDRTAAGNDVDPGVIDTIIRGLDKIKKAVKRFNSKEEVTGTVYEGEVLLYDEIGKELESLKEKIKYLMRTTTNNKWVSALGSALSALSNLDRTLSQHDAKLGAIITESEMNEGASDLTMKEKQLHGELSQVVSSYKNLKKAEKVNAVKALIPRVESGELSEATEVNEASVQVAGNAKPSGAQVLATVIVEHLITRDFFKPGIDKMKKDVIKDIQKVIMDSTF